LPWAENPDMTTEHHLAVFQRAAVDHIVERLSDKGGSRRFLLADEVGLGKTIVARNVISRMARKSRTRPFTVVYLCSNAEISEQNRRKLVDGEPDPIHRVTDLAYVRHRERHDAVRLYAFTPNTSLKGGTGLASERRLLLFLLDHVLGVDSGTTAFREYFRRSVNQESWTIATARAKLRAEFLGNISANVQAAFKQAIQQDDDLLDELTDAVARKHSHYQLIGRCRKALQRATLMQIQPDLVIMDEVQRFRDVLDTLALPDSLASALITEGTPTLILSATPYRMLSLSTDGSESEHHEEFHSTLRFLFGRHGDGPARIKRNLAIFGNRLKALDLKHERDDDLLKLKRSIEHDLRQVICRTERNWYFDEHSGALSEEISAKESLPTLAELKEYVAVENVLDGTNTPVGQTTDFWKSSPSLLTFMDSSYALYRRLSGGSTGREAKASVPRVLIESAGDDALPERSQRMRALLSRALGPAERPPQLWTAPSIRYMSQDVFGDDPPRKMLVFSGWRFVPKAIAVIGSRAAAARLERAGKPSAQPLQLKAKLSSHVLDVCLPSLALAEAVDPFALAFKHGARPTQSELLDMAVAELRTRFAEMGVKVVEKGGMVRWQAIMLLEGHLGYRAAVKGALQTWTLHDKNDPKPIRHHVARLQGWLDGPSGLTISGKTLRHIALIALGSPAVCLARGALRAFARDRCATDLRYLWRTTFEALRAYLNRRMVQLAIRLHAGKKRRRIPTGYSAKVLEYCVSHELQSVLDEHCYLAKSDGGQRSVHELAEHFRRIWSLEPGLRRTNAARRRGSDVIIGSAGERWPTHFALAFGDELKADEEKGSKDNGAKVKPLRRTDIREAFNSPFWPFVLATTSVGQEGLDFHWYCRDVLHWNLPSNPVDLEQREGRVNRRHGLAVRQSIAQDWPLSRVAQLSQTSNPWDAVFNKLETDMELQRYKQGLYPHWLYECKDSRQTRGVVRHVSYFRASRDAARYQLLKERLALYRLVFGQANQEHLLEDLHERLSVLTVEEQRAARLRLRGYMLNLSPVDRGEALKLAGEEAETLLNIPLRLRELIIDSRSLLVERSAELQQVADHVHAMLGVVDGHLSGAIVRKSALKSIVTALLYLRNPYDQYFDTQAVGGWDDDVEVLRSVRVPRAEKNSKVNR